MNRNVTARRTAFAFLALGVVLACSAPDLTRSVAARGAVASRHHESSEAAQALGPVASSARVASCRTRAGEVGEGLFGPSGGSLLVGSSELVIPPGALRETTRISGITRDDGTSTIDFYPQGLRFARPAMLRIANEGCSLPGGAQASATKVVYVDEAGTVLEVIPAEVDAGKRNVTAPIEHFSGYAIAF